ncbi:disease resistance protein L6-like isoform X2 [Syzygium oleosum]|uniref:disease resistance protein L6-like isoform X2 n=1 Tax=Syzygium oleosum TaxID=219896 RepID=UPI0024BAC7A0|nr:disease resistance protein L6-like isoform X2 [Syzygium oleosum]
MANLEAGRSGGGTPGGIRVVRKEDELCVGEVTGGELFRAIDNSIRYKPIFSRNHATSKWCLRELAGILPFFDLKPADVKLKTWLYSDAPLEHEKKFPEEVKAWQKALVEVNEIKG